MRCGPPRGRRTRSSPRRSDDSGARRCHRRDRHGRRPVAGTRRAHRRRADPAPDPGGRLASMSDVVPQHSPTTRASDADRDRVLQVLATATADGRLNVEEHSELMDKALTARTVGELDVLTQDLEAARPTRLARAAPLAPAPSKGFLAIFGARSARAAGTCRPSCAPPRSSAPSSWTSARRTSTRPRSCASATACSVPSRSPSLTGSASSTRARPSSAPERRPVARASSHGPRFGSRASRCSARPRCGAARRS